jgi:hypothetical protein
MIYPLTYCPSLRRLRLSLLFHATLLTLGSACLLHLFAFAALAQEEEEATSAGKSQTGEINIDLSSPAKRKDSYGEYQDEAISFFKQLAATTSKLSSGGSASVSPPSDEAMSYLTAVYLYCAVNSGTCPLVLDAILEADIVNSRSAGKASCPNMKRFWNTWVKNGFEDRHKFMVKTSHINLYSQFNSQTRPKYLKCDETVASVLSGIASSETFFRDRYRAGSPQEKLALKMTALLEQIKQKVPNLFIAMGAQSNSSGAGGAASAKKSGGTAKRTR